MTAHFFDIDLFFKSNQQVRLVDKTKPDNTILKFSKSDYNVLKNKLYLNQDLKLRIDNQYFYFNKPIYDKIKILCKKFNTNPSNLSFDFSEFKDELKFEINIDPIKHLFGTKDIVYIICSKMKNPFYEKMIEKLDNILRSNQIKPRDYYYLSENTTTMNDSDLIRYKKMKIFLQHLVGYKTNDNSFIDEKLTSIDDLYYYNDNRSDISGMSIFNTFFRKILFNTDEYLKDIIIKDTQSKIKTLTTHLVTSNRLNRFETNFYDLSYNNRLRRFKDF